MPLFCVAVNLRAVWKHSCALSSVLSTPFGLSNMVSRHHGRPQRSACGLWHLCISQAPMQLVRDLCITCRPGAVTMISNVKLPVCVCCRCCWLRQGCSLPPRGWRAQRCAHAHAPAAWLLFQAL